MTFRSGTPAAAFPPTRLRLSLLCTMRKPWAVLPAEQRATKLVSQMALEEKAEQIQQRTHAMTDLEIPANY